MKKENNLTPNTPLNSLSVEIKGSILRTLRSKANDQNYDLYLNFPRSYHNRTPEKKYPVLYILNGQWDFALMLGGYGNPRFDGLIAEIILVGITWSGDESDEASVRLGMRDFTPFPLEGTNHGGAMKFIETIENEIIPFVESNYPVTGNRGLMGSSIAAFFALYTLLIKPDIFHKFIISSPTVHWGNGALFYYEALFASKNKSLKKDIYLSYGQLEDSSQIKALITKLEDRNYEGLNLKTEEIEGVGHAGNKPIGYVKGLIHAYKKVRATVANDILLRYEGIYIFSKKTITIDASKDKLIMTVTESNTQYELLAENENSFYVNGTFLNLFFQKHEEKIKLIMETWDETLETFKDC